MSKAVIARGGIGFYLTARYIREMQDNYKKGDWLEAGKDSAFFAVAIAPVVAPRFFFTYVAFPVVMGVGAGTLAAMAIVEVTGIGEAEDVVDFVLDPDPVDWYKVVAPAVREKITEPIIEYVTEELWQKQLVDPITEWASEAERELREGVDVLVDKFKLGWSITAPF